jgi:hypothetical protein
VPLYPGHRPGNHLPPAHEPETRIERRNRLALEKLRAQQRTYYSGAIRRRLGQLVELRELAAKRSHQVLGYKNAGEPVPGWLSQSLLEVNADLRRIGGQLAVLRTKAWDAIGTAFPEERAA